jgi:hypothetical protein
MEGVCGGGIGGKGFEGVPCVRAKELFWLNVLNFEESPNVSSFRVSLLLRPSLSRSLIIEQTDF